MAKCLWLHRLVTAFRNGNNQLRLPCHSQRPPCLSCIIRVWPACLAACMQARSWVYDRCVPHLSLACICSLTCLISLTHSQLLPRVVPLATSPCRLVALGLLCLASAAPSVCSSKHMQRMPSACGLLSNETCVPPLMWLRIVQPFREDMVCCFSSLPPP